MPLEPPPRRKTEGVPFEKETTHGSDRPRNGSVYWRPLGPLLEVTVYPLLYGQYLLCTGRRDKDSWQVGYHYPDLQSAWRAAEDWDGKADPGYGWIREVRMNEDRLIEERNL
jgi:hypothetical protein